MTPEQYERLVVALEKLADATERQSLPLRDSVTYMNVDPEKLDDTITS